MNIIDYVGSWGPMILGHAHPKVIAAVKAAAAKGTSFGAPTLGETELAKKIIKAFKSIEKIRMVSSGTEAVMSAIRLARGLYRPRYDNKNGRRLSRPQRFAACQRRFGCCRIGQAQQVRACRADFAKLTCVVPYNDIDAVRSSFCCT